MALYSRPETSFWYYEFKVDGKRFRGSTKTADRTQAEAYEALERLKALQAAKDSRAAVEGAVSRTTLWDAAQSWLATTTLGDHKGNLSRVRKLFGLEMRLVGDLWREVPSNRFALSKTVAVADVSPGVLEELRESRRCEGNSAATIERELSLLRVLLVHAQTMAGIGAKPLKALPNMRRRASQAPKAANPLQTLDELNDRPPFSYDERRALGALAAGLSSHLRTIVAIEFKHRSNLDGACTFKVKKGPHDGLELAVISRHDWNLNEFRAEVRKAQVNAIRVWKTVN